MPMKIGLSSDYFLFWLDRMFLKVTLKDVVELALSSRFSEESLAFFETKISEHRHLFQTLFTTTRLRPKHHHLDHYPQWIRTFGPLIDFWTMRFEGKHEYFKKIAHATQNLRRIKTTSKNVCLTLAVRHQRMMGFHSASFFQTTCGNWTFSTLFHHSPIMCSSASFRWMVSKTLLW